MIWWLYWYGFVNLVLSWIDKLGTQANFWHFSRHSFQIQSFWHFFFDTLIENDRIQKLWITENLTLSGNIGRKCLWDMGLLAIWDTKKSPKQNEKSRKNNISIEKLVWIDQTSIICSSWSQCHIFGQNSTSISQDFKHKKKILFVDSASAEKITSTIREDFPKVFFSIKC